MKGGGELSSFEVWKCCVVCFMMLWVCSDIRLSNRWLTDQCWSVQHLEGSVYGLVEVLAWYYSGGTEEKHQKPHESHCPEQDMNGDPCKYRSRTCALLSSPGEYFTPTHPSTPFIVAVPAQRPWTDRMTPYCCVSTLWVSRHHSLVGFYVNKQKRTFRKQRACLWFSWEH